MNGVTDTQPDRPRRLSRFGFPPSIRIDRTRRIGDPAGDGRDRSVTAPGRQAQPQTTIFTHAFRLPQLGSSRGPLNVTRVPAIAYAPHSHARLVAGRTAVQTQMR